jgi:hypothetical protein
MKIRLPLDKRRVKGAKPGSNDGERLLHQCWAFLLCRLCVPLLLSLPALENAWKFSNLI